MLIKLTHYGTGNPTLLNSSNIENIYRVYDKVQRKSNTRIVMMNGRFLNVTESLKEVYDIQQAALRGEVDTTQWEDVMSVDEQLQDSFYNSYDAPPVNENYRDGYNRHGNYNSEDLGNRPVVAIKQRQKRSTLPQFTLQGY